MDWKKFLRRVFEVYRPFRQAMAGVFVFIAASQALNLIAPYLHGLVIDGLVNQKPIGRIYTLVGITLIVALCRVAVGYWREKYEINRIDFAIPHHMHNITLSQLFNYSIGQHVSENSGLKQTKIIRGKHSLNALAQTMLYQVIPTITEVFLLIIITLYFSKTLGLIMLVGVALHLGFMIYVNYFFKDDIEKVEKLDHKNDKFQGEILRNIELVLANSQEARAMRESRESMDGVFNPAKRLWLSFIRWAVIRSIIPIFTRFLVLAIGVFFVYRGQYTLGQLVMFLSWSTQALSQLSHIGDLHRQIMQMYISVKKYFDMLDIEPDVKVIANPVRPDNFPGKIEFKNVTFRYKRREAAVGIDEDDDDEEEKASRFGVSVVPALNNASFTIEAGETVAFVGESGAGKSTIVHALIRAQDPEAGQIIIDGNDLRVLDLKRFREVIGIVPQQVSLFDHTLRYNITYGLNGKSAGTTDAELDRIAKMSCVDRFFPRLENGYDTVIGERGVKLSGGECQRVGIARALIKNPDILIFDEATSNLDSENEALIRKSIEEISKGRTTIIIAHRFSTIRGADKIIVLDKGKVVGIGMHEELASSCAPYQKLIKNQVSI